MYAFYLLLLNQLCYVLNELLLVDTIGYFGHNNLVVRVTCFYVSFGTHDDASASCLISILDALQTHDVSTCGEIGTFHVLHKSLYIHVGIIHEGYTCINNLTQIMCGYVCGHTYSNTCGSVEQKVGQPGGHDGGFQQSIIEVVGHVHGLFFQIVHHGFAYETQSGLGISHGSRTVTVYATKVTLAIHQSVSHGPFLCHTHQGKIYRAVTMGVILTEYFTHDTRTFLIRSAVQIAHLFHSKKDASVYRFESVSNIGQCTCYDYAHRVVDVALPHLVLNVNFDYSFLIFHYVIIVSFPY